jgi:threonine dehydratase
VRSNLEFAEAHLGDVKAAAARISPHIRRTPALPTDLDPRLLLKAECFQVTGSFKARGAFNAILKLPAGTAGVVTASSGNHAQAVALAARTAGLKALILIPEGANPAKVAATRAFGAEVVSEGITFANRDQKLVDAVEESGYTLIHPYDDWDVIHGQGTGALELLEDAPDLEVVAAPVGGGGQLSGWALALKATRPEVKVIGVEPAAADDAFRSFRTGSLQRLERPPETIADGVKTLSIGRRNFETLVQNRLMDDIVTVSEAEIEQALLTAWLRCKLALEPTGALSLAAFLAGKLPDARRIGLVLSGGNADPSLVARLLQ